MVSDVTRADVREYVAEIERERGVQVLFACELGSRAGLASEMQSLLDVTYRRDRAFMHYKSLTEKSLADATKGKGGQSQEVPLLPAHRPELTQILSARIASLGSIDVDATLAAPVAVFDESFLRWVMQGVHGG